MKLIFMALILLVTNTQAQATQYKQWGLVGEETFRWLLLDIYHIKLISPSGTFNDESSNYGLHITYLRPIKAEDLITTTEKEWRNLGIDHQIIKPWLMTLSKIWPDIKKDDSLTLTLTQKKSTFYHNHTKIGEIQDPRFGPLFTSIWLSPKTSQPKLRKKLLGLN